MLQQSLMQAYSPFPNVPLVPSPYAGDATIRPLYGATGLGQGGFGTALTATVIASAISGALSGTAFYVYKRTESAAWAGATAGAGALALGLLGIGLGYFEAKQGV